jgi:hypothetical protein
MVKCGINFVSNTVLAMFVGKTTLYAPYHFWFYKPRGISDAHV